MMPRHAERLKVLVVDDSLTACRALQTVFEEAGWEVTTTDNPILVPGKIRRERPDVLVLDVDMPAVQGDEIVTILRQGNNIADVLIVLHSARPPADLAARARRCGADGFVGKAEGADTLVKRVSRLLRACRRMAPVVDSGRSRRNVVREPSDEPRGSTTEPRTTVHSTSARNHSVRDSPTGS